MGERYRGREKRSGTIYGRESKEMKCRGKGWKEKRGW